MCRFPGNGYDPVHSHRVAMRCRLRERSTGTGEASMQTKCDWLRCHANSVCQSSLYNPEEPFRTGALSCVTYKWYLRQKHTF